MRKLFLFMAVSLDGYIEGENHDLSWHNVDKEFNEFAVEQLQEIDGILFGRRTYELMRDYWPTAVPEDEYDKIVAEKMNSLPKIVVSHTMREDKPLQNWQHVSFITEDVVEQIKKIKNEEKGSMVVFGSNNLCVTLLENNLLDELRIMVMPVVIGKGTPLFAGIKTKYSFSLESTHQFKNGNMLLTYTEK